MIWFVIALLYQNAKLFPVDLFFGPFLLEFITEGYRIFYNNIAIIYNRQTIKLCSEYRSNEIDEAIFEIIFLDIYYIYFFRLQLFVEESIEVSSA